MKWLHDWIFGTTLERWAQMKGPTPWEVLCAVIRAVIRYVGFAFLVAALAVLLFIITGSTVCITIGGMVIAVTGFIFGTTINAEAKFVDMVEEFARRQLPNDKNPLSAGYGKVYEFVGNWRKNSRIFRLAIWLTNFIILMAGLVVAAYGERWIPGLI